MANSKYKGTQFSGKKPQPFIFQSTVDCRRINAVGSVLNFTRQHFTKAFCSLKNILVGKKMSYITALQYAIVKYKQKPKRSCGNLSNCSMEKEVLRKYFMSFCCARD